MYLFNKISEKNKEKLLYTLEAHTFTFPKNNKILSNLMEENIIGFVIEGYMQIIRVDYNGNITIIEELEENSVFGTMLSSLNNSEYEIITKEETKIVVIDYNRILNDNSNKPTYYDQFIKNLLEIVTDKINEKNERIEILTKKSIRDKLLEYFRITSAKNGSRIIYLTLNYSELANYLAVDRSAMSRELKNLKEEGFIKTESKKITLLY
jgi:CRP-like cAMP-binding protein